MDLYNLDIVCGIQDGFPETNKKMRLPRYKIISHLNLCFWLKYNTIEKTYDIRYVKKYELIYSQTMDLYNQDIVCTIQEGFPETNLDIVCLIQDGFPENE